MAGKATGNSQEAVRRVRERARTEGAEAALSAALRVCRDDKARAADQLDAANIILRLSGAYEGAGEDGREKELHEMNRAELTAAAHRAREYLDELEGHAEESGLSSLFD